VWGVQARVRINTVLLAPNADDPTMVDAALIGAWVDFRRLRNDARWTLFRRQSFRGSKTITNVERAIDPSAGGPDGPMFLTRFCSNPAPHIEAVEENGVFLYELGPGPIGNAGTFTCFFGSITQKLGSRFAGETENERDGEFFAMVSAPTESLLFDLIVHESLSEFIKTAQVRVLGALVSQPAADVNRNVLPVVPDVQNLGRNPPSFATSLVSNYAEAIHDVFQNLGWNAREFVGTRYTMDHPPFPSTLLVKFPLPERGK
jgi:hypothetical protein